MFYPLKSLQVCLTIICNKNHFKYGRQNDTRDHSRYPERRDYSRVNKNFKLFEQKKITRFGSPYFIPPLITPSATLRPYNKGTINYVGTRTALLILPYRLGTNNNKKYAKAYKVLSLL